MMDALHGKFQRFLDHKLFKIIVGALMFLNPVAIAPQVWAAFTAPSVDGISITMWVIFAPIQAAVTLEGIRVRSVPMFWSMLISMLQSMSVIVVVLVRG